MINQDQIKPHMPVVGSNDEQFALVDHVDGDQLKLTKDSTGHHHYIPLSWVSRVDDKVHVDRPGNEAVKQWRSS